MVHKIEERRLINGLLILCPTAHTKSHEVICGDRMLDLPWSRSGDRIKPFKLLGVLTPQHRQEVVQFILG